MLDMLQATTMVDFSAPLQVGELIESRVIMTGVVITVNRIHDHIWLVSTLSGTGKPLEWSQRFNCEREARKYARNFTEQRRQIHVGGTLTTSDLANDRRMWNEGR